MSARIWSPMQTAIFTAIRETSSSLLVEAVAGSGKTTTIVEAVGLCPPRARVLFLAFNKRIAEELKTRSVPASTFHALGYSALRNAGFKPKVDGFKCTEIFRRIVAADLHEPYEELPRLISLLKNFGYGLPGVEFSPEELLANYDFSFPNDAKAFSFAKRILEISNSDRKTIDFDDMLYLPALLDLPFAPFDVVFVDEAQDTNPLQYALLERISHASTRFIFVGDRHQAIYGFRGAGTDSLSVIADRFHTSPLPLSVSYRCPKAIVREAAAIVPAISSAAAAPEGAVTHHESFTADIFPPDSAIVCRNVKPLIKLAYSLIRDGKKVQVLGREIGKGFKRILAKALDQKPVDKDALVELLFTMLEAEESAELAKEHFVKAGYIRERYESLIFILENSPITVLSELASAIDDLFSDKRGAITLCTIHKAKGLEWPDVFILDRWRIPSQFAQREWELEQEQNLLYVAITRAQKHLHFINSAD